MKHSQRQVFFNVCIGLVIVYFVLYRVLQQKAWDNALAKYVDIDIVNSTTSQAEKRQKDVNVSFSYTTRLQSGDYRTGRNFSVQDTVLTKMGIPPTTYFSLSQQTARNFVFVTAVDSSHFEELRDCIASLQLYFSGYHIHLYDLGMTTAQRDQSKRWCDVKYHKFDPAGYPKHVGKITYKAFKFLVIQDVLRQYGAAFWVDASFRATDHIDQWQDIFDLAVSNGGIVMVYNETGQRPLTNYAWSDPHMFEYLPTDLDVQQQLIQQCSCAVLVYNTKFVFSKVLWWMYLCSLERDCITRASGTASIDWQTLDHDQLRSTFIVHRYDQSALNTILSNYFEYDQSKYTTINNHNVINRTPTELFTLNNCS